MGLFYSARAGWATLGRMPQHRKNPFGSAFVRCSRAVLRLAALLVVGSLAVGCVTTEPLEPLDVTLVDVEFIDATIFESTLDVAVRISNDNPEALTLDGAVIKLELAGRKFGKGSTSERLEIPRLGSVVQRLKMHLNHIAVATKIRSVIDSQRVDYAITGKVYVLTPSGSVRRLPIDKQGTIDLSGKAPQELPEDKTPAGAIDK